MKYCIGMLIGICLLTGCSMLPSAWYRLAESQIYQQNPVYDVAEDAPTKLEDIILYEIAHNRTEELMDRFAPSTVEELGEENLRAQIEQMNEILHGTIERHTVETTGFSSYRGRGGKRSTGYLMTLYTDKEIFLLFYQNCTEDTSAPDHKNNSQSIGLTSMCLIPAYLWHDRENTPRDAREGVKIYQPERYARDIAYPDKTYTMYSIEYLQVTSTAYSFETEICHTLMDLLSTQCGFVGDITYAESNTIESSLYGSAFTQMVQDENGTKFYIKTEYLDEGGKQITCIADEQQNIIYQNPKNN